MRSKKAQGREWFRMSWRQLVRCLKRMQTAYEAGGYVPMPVRRSPRVLQRDKALLIELEKKIQMLLNSKRFQNTRSGLHLALTDADRAEILCR